MTQQQQPLTDEQRIKRAKRGCFIALMPLWVVLSLALILGGFFLAGKVERDAAVIEAHVSDILDMNLPEGFYAFSKNSFMGTEAISFYHKDHLREDGRTTSLISIQRERSWGDLSVEALTQKVLPVLQSRLARREFEVEEKVTEKVKVDGETLTIYRFSGRQLMDEEVLKATTCFRFVMGPRGPVQLQTMGLNTTFPAEDQVKLLAGIKPKKP
ncbi:MAG: hypothetical protein QNK37_15420 [Acidobacteriota bacterium]|nr:hypothetical protein [Acidobacteriota bacterium]